MRCLVTNFFRQAKQNASAVLRRHASPGTGFEGTTSSFGGTVHILGGRIRGVGDHFFCRGIDDLVALPFGAGVPFAVDEQVVCLHVSFDSSCQDQSSVPGSGASANRFSMLALAINKKQHRGGHDKEKGPECHLAFK